MTTSYPTRTSVPRGFTFAEIMFAVVILGIGFIMVAAMFPVAIRQTQSTIEDLNGIAEAKRGSAIMQQLGVAFAGYNPKFTQSAAEILDPGTPAFNYLRVTPQDPAFQSAGAPLHHFFTVAASPTVPYEFVRGDLVNQYDQRFAFIPVAYQVGYQATNGSVNVAAALDLDGGLTTSATGTNAAVSRLLPTTARIWVVAVQKRDPDNPRYNRTDLQNGTTESPTSPTTPIERRNGTFKPKVVFFKLVEGEEPSGFGANYPDTLVFTSSAGVPQDEPAAAEGAFVWVADDRVTNSFPGDAPYYQRGAAHGRFYRLGAQLPADTYGPGVWELVSGYDMQIVKNPGPDASYGTADDDIYQQRLENLPPRDFDNPHPYATRNYSGISGAQNSNPAKGFMIGKGLKDPALDYNAATNPYIGTAQDLFALPPITVTIKN